MNDSLPKDAQLVWDEYHYRHEHIWSTLYKLTYTVGFLEVLPYLERTLAKELGFAMLMPCILGFFLGLLGSVMILRELKVFKSVKERHRSIHNHRDEILGKPFFETAVITYLGVLVAVALINTVWIMLCWL